MSGMAAYATWAPAGNWAEKDAGRRFVSSFCRTVLQMATPHICGASVSVQKQRRQSREPSPAYLRERPQEDVQRERGRVRRDGERREDGEVRRAVDEPDARARDDLEADRARAARVVLERGQQAVPEHEQAPAEPDGRAVPLRGGDRRARDDGHGRDGEGDAEDVDAGGDRGRVHARLVVHGEIVWSGSRRERWYACVRVGQLTHEACERDR